MSVTRGGLVAGGLVFGAIALVITIAGADGAFAQSGPFGVGRPPSVPADGVVGWLLAEQARFYRALSGLIRAAKVDGSATWTLLGMSFAYGVFHAAGPGHGKAVISSYLIANEETFWRGVVLSFASALLQAFVAVAVVAVAAIALGATAKTMNAAVSWIEVASYALIALIGARLVWVKGRVFFRAWHTASADARNAPAPEETYSHAPHDHAAQLLAARLHEGHAHHAHPHAAAAARADVMTDELAPAEAGPPCDHDHHLHDHHPHDHAHHDHGHDHAAGCGCGHDHGDAHDHHDHDHDHGSCGHAHGPEPQELAGPGGWSRGLAAIVAVGLRPCSGAILVLVFAFAQGLFWAGVASTFVMGLGTALTVAAIATLAVGARAFANRLLRHRSGSGALVLHGIEVAAALVVLVFGVALLTGYVVSERMI